MNSQRVALTSLVRWTWLLSPLTSDLSPPATFPALRELTEEERQQILHSSDFQSFFDCSIRVVERALAEDGDIFFDYSGRDLEDKEGSAGERKGVGGGQRRMFAGVSLTQRGAGTESQPQSGSRLWLLCSQRQGLRVSFFKGPAAGSNMASSSRWRSSRCLFQAF